MFFINTFYKCFYSFSSILFINIIIINNIESKISNREKQGLNVFSKQLKNILDKDEIFENEIMNK